MKQYWKRIVSMMLMGVMMAQAVAFTVEVSADEVSTPATHGV